MSITKKNRGSCSIASPRLLSDVSVTASASAATPGDQRGTRRTTGADRMKRLLAVLLRAVLPFNTRGAPSFLLLPLYVVAARPTQRATLHSCLTCARSSAAYIHPQLETTTHSRASESGWRPQPHRRSKHFVHSDSTHTQQTQTHTRETSRKKHQHYCNDGRRTTDGGAWSIPRPK